MAEQKLSIMYQSVIILILLAILIGVGTTVLDNMSTATRTAGLYANDTFVANNVTYQSLTNSYISTIATENPAPYFRNNSNTGDLPAGCFVFDVGGKFAASKVLLNANVSGCNAYNNTRLNATYYYGVSSTASNSLTTSSGAVDNFPDWFAIIIIIIIAAVIIGLIMRSFTK